MYFSNFLTCFLNVSRLLKISNANVKLLSSVFIPLATALFVVFGSRLLLSHLTFLNTFWYSVIFCVFSCAIYILVLFALKIVKKEVEIDNGKPQNFQTFDELYKKAMYGWSHTTLEEYTIEQTKM